MVNLILYLLALALLAYTAVLYGSEALVVLALCGVTLSVFAYLYIVIQMFAVKTELSLPISMVEQGMETELVIKVTNRGIFPASKLRFYIRCKNRLAGKRKKLVVNGAAEARNCTMVYQTVEGRHCGNCNYTLRTVRVYDLTGIFYLTKWSKQSVELNVMPHIYGMTVQVTERARHFFGETENYDDRNAGSDASEIFSVRSFRDGDRIQSIHWKMSAKTDELMVRENSLPLGCPVAVLLDFAGKKGKTDEVLTVVASLSCALVEQKCAHYIAWYDRLGQDVARMRVAAEEDVYRFLLMFYMEAQKSGADAGDLRAMYREKYRMENIVAEITVNGRLELWRDDIFYRKIDGHRLERELKDVEVVV